MPVNLGAMQTCIRRIRVSCLQVRGWISQLTCGPWLPRVLGLLAVGSAPPYGNFSSPSCPSDNARIEATLRVGKEDAFRLEQSQSDTSKGFCTQPLTKAELLRHLRGQP